jgi:surface antigen
MSKRPGRAVALLAAFWLAGCAGSDYGAKQTIGALAGAAGGGLLGAQFGHGPGQLAATAAGTMVGALLGGTIGKSLDETDKMYASRAEYHALEYTPSGSEATWRNPDSGNYGAVTPTYTYQSPDGDYCREFQQKATIGGKSERVYGTACRQPDGQWQLVN